MFGGKKLKDLTEEDIRRYAESLAKASGALEEDGGQELSKAEEASGAQGEEPPVAEAKEESADGAAAEATAANSTTAAEGAGAELALRSPVQGPAERTEAEAKLLQGLHSLVEKHEAKPLTKEELLRLQVLCETGRSQMPAVHKDGGLLQKTIEHYTFADAFEAATVYIELEKDLFEGAAAHLTESSVEVVSKDTEVTVLLHGIPASKTTPSAAEWRLHLSPLFHSIEPSETTWKIRKGKVSVRLKKKKPQDWRRLLKL